MKPIRILVDSFADAGLPNAQMGNAREIIRRLDPDMFHVTTFVVDKPDPRIAERKNTRLIQLPKRRQTVRILSEFLTGQHELLFYMKASPASKWYSSLRRKWPDHRVTIGTIETRCDYVNEPSLAPEALQLWEQTILACDYLYSNAPYVRWSLEHEYSKNSDVVPTGADTRFFTPAMNNLPNQRPRVLFVGSLVSRKRPDILLAAAAQFPHADFRLAGEGKMRSELEARISREGLRNVTLTGCLGEDQLREEYRHADIFFFPSLFEGSPKVIVEAAACGVPAIIRDAYEAETVMHGVTGFQSKTDDEMFSYLKLLVEDPILRRDMGRAGCQHVQKFDWDPIAAQWAKIFLELAPSRQLRRAS